MSNVDIKAELLIVDDNSQDGTGRVGKELAIEYPVRLITRTLERGLAWWPNRWGQVRQKVVFIALGEDASPERSGQAEVRFVPYKEDPGAVARYYQAADIYIHAARAEVWGLTITEALACGTPVVATAVGGIPEQVKGLEISGFDFPDSDLKRYGMDEATGVLVPPENGQAMGFGIELLLNDDSLAWSARRECGSGCGQAIRLPRASRWIPGLV